VALPGAVRDPGLAGCDRALQANGLRGGLGADPANLPSDGDVPYAIIVFAFSMGLGLLIATWTVRYRDLGFLVQMGQYVSPVAYSTTIVPEQWQFLYGLNPMVGVLRFRATDKTLVDVI